MRKSSEKKTVLTTERFMIITYNIQNQQRVTLQFRRPEDVKGETRSQIVHRMLDRWIQSLTPALKLQMFKQEK